MASKNTDYSLSNKTGWWYSIRPSADMDNEEDSGSYAGLGTNYKYKATDAPFEVISWFPIERQTTGILLSYFRLERPITEVGPCSSEQMPFI